MPKIALQLSAASWMMSGLLTAFILLDAVAKLVPLQIFLQTTGEIGYPTSIRMVRGPYLA